VATGDASAEFGQRHAAVRDEFTEDLSVSLVQARNLVPVMGGNSCFMSFCEDNAFDSLCRFAGLLGTIRV
jgi:hypothetical protein